MRPFGINKNPPANPNPTPTHTRLQVLGDDTHDIAEGVLVLRAAGSHGGGSIDYKRFVYATVRQCTAALNRFLQRRVSDSTPLITIYGHITLDPPPPPRFLQRCATWRQVYCMFDADGSGDMDAYELANATTQLFGWRYTRYECDKLLAYVDRTGEGKCFFPGFCHIVASPVKRIAGTTF